MKAAILSSALALCFLTGCSTPGAQYAGSHPELSPAHRQILLTGNIPAGTAVEGMTKEQVRLASGEPMKVEKANGKEVWVYLRRKALETSPANDPGAVYGSGPNEQRNFTETAQLGPRPTIIEVTGVFFRGDRATHTEVRQRRD